MSAIAQAFRAACRDEIAAPKPGNVHVFAPGHGMSADDFLASAELSAPAIALCGAPVGTRILRAVEATRRGVGSNTNLGIILLCAPLAAAAGRGGVALRSALEAVLAELDRADAVDAFAAIRLAAPGGLASAERHDVHSAPECTLREAMAAAAERDRIAAAYVNCFEDVFSLGFAALAEARDRTAPGWWPATVVYLTFLSTFPDSHILRKHGAAVARAVRDEAKEKLQLFAAQRNEERLLANILEFDRLLKSRKLNPGTSADFTVATLFAARLSDILQERREGG